MKNNYFKHLFTALLLLCVTAATAHDFEMGGIYYNILSEDNKTVEVTYKGTFYFEYSNEYSGSVVIPETVTHNGTTYSVTSIGGSAFEGCAGLTSIEIGNSITSIGTYAFYGCTGLINIVVDEGNSTYDSRDNCNAIIETATNKLIAGCRNTVIPNSVTSIGGSAFERCAGLTSIEIGNSITSIGTYAFYGCTGLTSITIPNSVTSIGDAAFAYCPGLTSIIVESGNMYYDSRDNCNAIIETATNTLLAGCQNTIIPNDVTSIGTSAFHGCTGLTSITIPNSVTSIGELAFHGCTGLTSITIPNSVTSIGAWAFQNCSGLTSIEIGNSVTSIGDYAFMDCTGLTSITIPNSVTSIGIYAFEGCSNIETLYISSTIESIGIKAFDRCDKIKEIKVGAEKPIRGDENIFTDAVYNNATLYIPNGTKSLYEKREPWNIFFNIVEIDFTGIEDVYDEVKGENGKVQTIYDLQGRKVEVPSEGLYIINGKKVVVK